MLIFDYATKFRFENESIPSPSEFMISDTEYSKFKNWLSTKEFNYKTATENRLKVLKETAKKDNYYEAIENEIIALEEKVGKEKEEYLENYETEIRELLKDEIVSRYYYSKGRIQSSLKNDPDVVKALEILLDSEKYNAILNT